MMYLIKALREHGEHIRNQKSVNISVKYIKYCYDIVHNAIKMFLGQIKFQLKITSIHTDVKPRL